MLLPPPKDPMVSHASLLQPSQTAIHIDTNACNAGEVEFVYICLAIKHQWAAPWLAFATRCRSLDDSASFRFSRL
jgi:hypothetical protein